MAAATLAEALAGSPDPSPSECQALACHRQASGSLPDVPDSAGTSPARGFHESLATRSPDDARSGQYPDHLRPLRPCWPAPASMPVAGSFSSVPPKAALTLCLPVHARAADFVAGRITRSFTARYARPPRLRWYLTPCLLHRHAAEHSLSFGPSPPVSAFSGHASAYYDCC